MTLYYMVYAAFALNQQNEHLAYSTSTSPTGPWMYGCVLMEAGDCFTNHPGIASRDILICFTILQNCLAEAYSTDQFVQLSFKQNEDGSIDTVKKCDSLEGIE